MFARNVDKCDALTSYADVNKNWRELLLPQQVSGVSVHGMSEPILPTWAVKVDDADSTAVLDFVGPTRNPVPSLGLMLTQRCSSRARITLIRKRL